MQKVSNIIPYFRKELSSVFDDREVISWGYLSIEHILGYNRSDCIIYKNNIINDKISTKFQKIINDLKQHKPLQYILGETKFYNCNLKLNKHTLIPRSETHEIVDWILQEKFESALDIGTGSGCIAIALGKHSNAHVSAIDISKEAIDLAKENAVINNVTVSFIHQDIFQIHQVKKIDVIVSNPPYILNIEKEKMSMNVLDHEPHSALFVSDEDPLIFYKKIIEISTKSLHNHGKLFFEINENFGRKIMAILHRSGFVDIELKKDINDKDRMIKAVWK